MKVAEIRELSLEERLSKLDDLREEMFNLRFQHEIGQLENPKKMMQTKADIARIKTVIRELELTGSTDKE
ncbi:MAG: 50S ribosomal protein L29 [Desulfobacteraceae bacterium 4572_123]|nr:MAG: 50S ribosomal protein L29 [Desulfobacteraceae bacterium 4572_123]